MPTFLFHMRAEAIAAKVSEHVMSEVSAMGFDLLEVTFSHGLLRLTIDAPQGVTLDDCVAVNRRVGLILDTLNYFPGRYRLEVSSPGLNRKLESRKDFEHFAGRMAKVQTGKDIRRGILKGVDGDDIIMEVEGAREHIAMADIVKANLDFEF